MKFFSDNHPKKVLLLLGHPDSSAETLSSQLLLLYETAARKAGHEIKRFNLGEMKFDPVLHRGYRAVQPLEPDLKAFQEAVNWCDHLVIMYPNWWSSMPALLKGLFDRCWLPGFAFKYYKEGVRARIHLWKKMEKGKTARVFVLSGSHPTLLWLFVGDYTNEIQRGVLWFVGFKVRITRWGPAEDAPEWQKNIWRRRVIRLGTHGE